MVLGPVTRAFDPVLCVPAVVNLEVYWQWGKIWRQHARVPVHTDRDRAVHVVSPSLTWEAFQQQGYRQTFDPFRDRPRDIRRPADVAGLPIGSRYFGLDMGYVLSRKLVYVPLYASLLGEGPCPLTPDTGSLVPREQFQAVKRLLTDWPELVCVVHDFDGPTTKIFGPRLGKAQALAASTADWTTGIDHPGLKFGHGFVVSALLAELPLASFLTLSLSEQREYRNAVELACEAGRPWSHPPFLLSCPPSASFATWMKERTLHPCYVPGISQIDR